MEAPFSWLSLWDELLWQIHAERALTGYKKNAPEERERKFPSYRAPKVFDLKNVYSKSK